MSVTRLPPEILITILEHCVANYYNKKNEFLQLRTVCRLFDDILKPYGLHTLQVDYTRLDKSAKSNSPPLDVAALDRAGRFCRALYIDMMLIRDEGQSLHQVTQYGCRYD